VAKTFQEMGGAGVIIRSDGTKLQIHQNTGKIKLKRMNLSCILKWQKN